jgi:N-acyl-D-aspartate/D-glutamate deacylase
LGLEATVPWLLALALLLLAGCRQAPSEPSYDLVITGGSVFDGEGSPPAAADVGVRDGRIAVIAPGGRLADAGAARRIDAGGLAVAPGFIDIHNHSDYTILIEPKAESAIRQGITTVMLGESRSAGPVKSGGNEDPRSRSDGTVIDWTTLGGYFERLERQGVALNVASYVGHEQVWTYVKGYGQTPIAPAELEEMKRLVAQAMEQGAMG